MSKLKDNEKVGEYHATDVYEIGKGVYQATLEKSVSFGVSAAGSYFVLDPSAVKKLPPEYGDLLKPADGRFVIENPVYEYYVLRELISRNVIPPRDESYTGHLDEYIKRHPFKYRKLFPVTALDFSFRFKELLEMEKDSGMEITTLGGILTYSMSENEKNKLYRYLEDKKIKGPVGWCNYLKNIAYGQPEQEIKHEVER